MSDPFDPDDLPEDADRALAAEYVLRLLDPAEEAVCAARVASDPAFAAEVERWQGSLSALDAAFVPVSPPPRLRARIEERLFGRPPSLLARFWASAPLWRAVAAAAIVGAVAIGYVGRSQRAIEQPQLIATVSPITGNVQLVALVDRDADLLRFSRLAGAPAAGRSLELWLLPAGETVPAALGLVPGQERFSVPIPQGFEDRVGPGAQILVSDEVEGGSPTGLPQGTVLAGGTIGEL